MWGQLSHGRSAQASSGWQVERSLFMSIRLPRVMSFLVVSRSFTVGIFNAAPSPCGIELTRSVWNSDTVTCDTPVASGRPRDSWSDRCESRSSTSFDRIVRDRGSRTARSSRAAVQPVVLRSNAVNARSSVVQREVTARSSVALRGQRWCTVQPVVQRSNARSLPRDRSCAARSLRMKKQRRSPGPLQANVRK